MSAVPQDFPFLQPGQGVLDACPGSPVEGVLGILPRAQTVLASSCAVRDEQSGAVIAAIGDPGSTAAGPFDAGLGEGKAVVADAGQRMTGGHGQAAVGVDDHL